MMQKLTAFLIQEDKKQYLHLQETLTRIYDGVNLNTNDRIAVQRKINRVTIEQCNRLKSTAGSAHYWSWHIKLHSAYFDKQDECYANRWETIFHEIAHLVSYAVFGDRGRGHRQCWRYTFRQFGYVPKRCYDSIWSYREHKKRKEIREVKAIANVIGNFNI